jgi:hypothetical protein
VTSEVNDALNTAAEFLRILGPFAGVYFAARVIISYQRDLLGSLTEQNSSLRAQLDEQDQRIDHLEDLILKLRREQARCERRNSVFERRNDILIDAVQRAGIQVPPLPPIPADPPVDTSDAV